MRLRNVLRLARRRLRHSWHIHAAAVLLTALTGSAFLLYQSYLTQMGTSLDQQTHELRLLSDLYVELPADGALASPVAATGAWKKRPAPVLVAAGRTFSAGSAYGRLQAFAIQPSEDYRGPSPSAGEALLPQRELERLNLQVGSTVEMLLPGGTLVQVVLRETYEASPANSELLVNFAWYEQLSGEKGFTRFMFNLIPGLGMQAAQLYLERLYPPATIVTRQLPADLAHQAVSESHSSGSSLVILIFLFLALGVFTALLLSFMDNKRELAVLKSMGLSPRELGGLFLGSGLFTAFSGILMALGLAYQIVHFLNARGVMLPVEPGFLPQMLVWTSAAYAAAIGIPAALSHKATVNQLLYDQPIPLISHQVHTLRQRNLHFEEKIRRGWQVVRLPVDEGVLLGFVFKKAGDLVKKGEVLAYAPGWWGLTYTEYIASVDGRVDAWQEETGYLSIRPHHLATEGQPDDGIDLSRYVRADSVSHISASNLQREPGDG